MIFIIACVSALIWHFLLEKMWLSNVGATITSILISSSLMSSHFGWLDATFYKNLFTVVTISLVISIFFGIAFKVVRKNK